MTADAPPLSVHRPGDAPAEGPLPGEPVEQEEEPEGFRVGLDLYVGPVDLLHHLARRSEVDLLDLPLAAVVGQFEAYSKALGYLDLDGTGDFLSAATHLVEMKSKRALPVAPKKQKEEAPSEDRTALLSRLLEYRRYKEAAAALERRAAGAAERLPRIVEKPAAESGAADRIRDVELWDLVGALARVLEPAEDVGAGTVKREEIPVAKWVETLGARIREEGRVQFETCFDDPSDRSAVTGGGGGGVPGGAGVAPPPRVPGGAGRELRPDRAACRPGKLIGVRCADAPAVGAAAGTRPRRSTHSRSLRYGLNPASRRPLMPKFEVVSEFAPAGDQPKAIDALTAGLKSGERDQVLLGVTGSGKTFTVANVIERVQKPTLVLSHNKTLAAQLYGELKEFFPKNAVSYFVSYYDYYQPEAYIPARDIYIEKDSSINEEIDRLRLQATSQLVSRRDVIVVASVSCIYGLGSPKEYVNMMVPVRVGEELDRDEALLKFIDIQYDRNDYDLARGRFRVRGDTIELWPAYEEFAYRIELWGDEVEALSVINPTSGETIKKTDEAYIYPAKHFVMPADKMGRALKEIDEELNAQLEKLPQGGQAAGGPAPVRPHPVRHGTDEGGRVLPRHRELQPGPRRPKAGAAAGHAARLLPEGLPHRHRRVARHRPAGPGDVQRRPGPQADLGGARVPPADGDG